MGVRFAGLAVQAKVRPEGRSDEAHMADSDGGRVEQGHAAVGAVERQQAPGLLDIGAVELVVAGDKEDMRRALPDLGREPDRAVFRRRQVARQDDDLRPRGERRDFTAIFEMGIGEDLDAHGTGLTVPGAGAQRLRRFRPSGCGGWP